MLIELEEIYLGLAHLRSWLTMVSLPLLTGSEKKLQF
jgi:hypothetical protein